MNGLFVIPIAMNTRVVIQTQGFLLQSAKIQIGIVAKMQNVPVNAAKDLLNR